MEMHIKILHTHCVLWSNKFMRILYLYFYAIVMF